MDSRKRGGLSLFLSISFAFSEDIVSVVSLAARFTDVLARATPDEEHGDVLLTRATLAEGCMPSPNSMFIMMFSRRFLAPELIVPEFHVLWLLCVVRYTLLARECKGGTVYR